MIQYFIYLTQTKWKGFKYFSYRQWLDMNVKKKNGDVYLDEYGGIHNIVIKC